MDEMPDYMTVIRIPGSKFYVTRRMTWNRRDETYCVRWQSPSKLSLTVAQGLAQLMAKAEHIGYRP